MTVDLSDIKLNILEAPDEVCTRLITNNQSLTSKLLTLKLDNAGTSVYNYIDKSKCADIFDRAMNITSSYDIIPLERLECAVGKLNTVLLYFCYAFKFISKFLNANFKDKNTLGKIIPEVFIHTNMSEITFGFTPAELGTKCWFKFKYTELRYSEFDKSNCEDLSLVDETVKDIRCLVKFNRDGTDWKGDRAFSFKNMTDLTKMCETLIDLSK